MNSILTIEVSPTGMQWLNFWLFLAVVTAVAVIIELFVRIKENKKFAIHVQQLRDAQVGLTQKLLEDLRDEIQHRFVRLNSSLHVAEEISPGVKKFTEHAAYQTKLLTGSADDYVWLLDTKHEDLSAVLTRLKEIGERSFQNTGIHFSFTLTGETGKGYKLPAAMSRNIFMIFREAINNCLEHSSAHTARLHAEVKEDDALQIVFKDDGKGFDTEAVKLGYGIANMQTRTGRLKGRLYIDAWPGKGAIFSLSFRLPDRYIT